MKRISILLCALIFGISAQLKAETANEIYNKLVADCNELKSKDVINADCNNLNTTDLRKIIENGLKVIENRNHEYKVKELTKEYFSIVNNLNKATLYSDYANICESLKSKIQTAKFGTTCELPKNCYDTDIDTIRDSIYSCSSYKRL